MKSNIYGTETQTLLAQHSVGIWTILWLVLGVGTAYRLGVGEIE